MPEIFQPYHKDMMERWMRNGNTTSDYLERINHGFIRTKSGYIVATDYQVLFNPQEETFVTFFKLDSEKSMNYHVIIDTEGIIREISAMASVYFNITREVIKSEEVYIHTLFTKTPLKAFLAESTIRAEMKIDDRDMLFEI